MRWRRRAVYSSRHMAFRLENPIPGIIVLFCRHVAKSLADQKYWELPLYKRLGLRVHVALCFVCGRYNRQVLLLQQISRAFLEKEEEMTQETDIELTEEAQRRMQELIRKEL